MTLNSIRAIRFAPSKDPWMNIEERYAVGSTVQGKVTNVVDFGAFIQIEEGVVELIHVSEMSWTRKKVTPSDFAAEGDEVKVRVLKISKDLKCISPSTKQIQNPLELLVQKYRGSNEG